MSFRALSRSIALGLTVAITALVAASWVLHGAPPPPVTMATPGAPGTSPQRAGGIDWYAIPEPPVGLITAAVDGGSDQGFLAFASDPITRTSAQLWRLGTEFTWMRVDGVSFAPQGQGRRQTVVRAIARQYELLVAVGIERFDDDSAGDAAAWWSADGGTTWQRAAVQLAADATMTDVTKGPAGWIAVGSDGYPGSPAKMSGARGMAVWHSPDGKRWDRVPRDAALSGAAIPTHLMPGLDTYVASGLVRPGSADKSPLWASKDGTTWQRVRTLSATEATVVNAADQGRWVAAGISADGQETPGFWWSTDGREWRSAVVQPAMREAVAPTALARYAGGWMAFGTDRSVENRPHIAIWTSSDAEQWQEIQTPPLFDRAAEPTVTQGASGLLVFGEQIDGNSTPTNALTWIAPYP